MDNSELIFSIDSEGRLQLPTLCLYTEEDYNEPLCESECECAPAPSASKFIHFDKSSPCFAAAPCSAAVLGSCIDIFRKKTEELIDLGLTDEQLMEIIKSCRKQCKIVIDRHYRVFLADGGMTEIKMSPLSKTIFLFYLKHPEGVALKCLSDYKTELGSIYSHLTGRESVDDIEKSICDLVDPTSNSVHEKCSRIKAAFKGKVSASSIEDYVPSGAPGEPRFISLDRNLITWDGCVI